VGAAGDATASFIVKVKPEIKLITNLLQINKYQLLVTITQ